MKMEKDKKGIKINVSIERKEKEKGNKVKEIVIEKKQSEEMGEMIKDEGVQQEDRKSIEEEIERKVIVKGENMEILIEKKEGRNKNEEKKENIQIESLRNGDEEKEVYGSEDDGVLNEKGNESMLERIQSEEMIKEYNKKKIKK